MITELPDSSFPAQGLLMMELFILIIAFSRVGFEEIERALKPRYSKETETGGGICICILGKCWNQIHAFTPLAPSPRARGAPPAPLRSAPRTFRCPHSVALHARPCLPRHRRKRQADRPHLSARGPVYAQPPGPRSPFGLSCGPPRLPPPEIMRLQSALPPRTSAQCLSTSHDAHSPTGPSLHRQAARKLSRRFPPLIPSSLSASQNLQLRLHPEGNSRGHLAGLCLPEFPVLAPLLPASPPVS